MVPVVPVFHRIRPVLKVELRKSKKRIFKIVALSGPRTRHLLITGLMLLPVAPRVQQLQNAATFVDFILHRKVCHSKKISFFEHYKSMIKQVFFPEKLCVIPGNSPERFHFLYVCIIDKYPTFERYCISLTNYNDFQLGYFRFQQ